MATTRGLPEQPRLENARSDRIRGPIMKKLIAKASARVALVREDIAHRRAQARARAGSGAPLFELQYHPSDIRKNVRYFFLASKHVTYGAAGLALFLLFLGFAAMVAPGVIADSLAARRYQALVPQRAPLGAHLETLTEKLALLEQESDAARLELEKIYLAYGLSTDNSIGQGGYPFAAKTVPDSIYANTIRRGNELEARIEEQLAVLGIFLDEVRSFESAFDDQVRTTPSICPLRGDGFVLTSPFGSRRSPFTKEVDFHNGIDLAAATGTPIHAPADATVVFAGRVPEKRNIGWWRYGNLVALNHGDRFITLFAHCDTLTVKKGDRVRQGDVIGTVGNTGWSTSPHLHYEVRRINEETGAEIPKDPRIYILDHRWRDEEQLLIRARTAPDYREYEPLPPVIRQ